MEELSRHVKEMQVINKRIELVRAFLTVEKDEEYEVVEDLNDKKDEQDQELSISQPLVRDEENAEDKDLKVLKPLFGKTDNGNGEMLLTGQTPSEQSTASEQRKKSCDSSEEEINDALLLETLRNICDMFLNVKDEEEITRAFCEMNVKGPYFHGYEEFNRDSSRKYCEELWTEKHNEYLKNPNRIPDLGTLIFFKLALFVYPPFEVSHPINTSCLNFMSEILTTCRFENVYSISRGLFVCTLISEYTLLTNRSYVPVAVNFLKGVLLLSTKSTILNSIEPVPTFDLNKDSKILLLEDDCSKLDVGMKTSVLDLLKDSIDNGFKIRTLYILEVA